MTNRLSILILLCLIFNQKGFTQEQVVQPISGHQGDFYFYWGWNSSGYTPSDITFWGNNYRFTLDEVKAADHQSHFDLNKYFNPAYATIPQYNFRMGYFINDKYNVSIGLDHMKYIMVQNQTVKISGSIQNSQTSYDDVYQNQDIILSPDFLKFEHTDGLNYLNVSIRRFDQLIDLGHFRFNLTEGFEMGAMVPRTNATLLNKPRHDEFHLSGFGLSSVLGLNIEIYKHFFIQSELKGGYINMPDIRTTYVKSDRASQQFLFTAFSIDFGATFNIHKKADQSLHHTKELESFF